MRVAITAAAVRTALGDDADRVWRAIAAGESAVGPVQGFDASGFGDVQAAQIWTEPETAEDDPALRILGPHGRLLDAVAMEAHAAAGLASFTREHVGLFVAMGMVDSPIDDLAAAALASREGGDAMSMKTFFAGAYRQIHPLWPLSMLNNVAAGQIAIDLDIRGDNVVLASDGDAGVRAILEGAYALEEGSARAVLAAGVSGRVSPAHLARLALDVRLPGPACFETPGEGGAALVLEREDEARARGAPILGFLRGGSTAFGGEAPELRAARSAGEQVGRSPDVPIGVQFSPPGIGYLGAGGPATMVAVTLAEWRAHPSDSSEARVGNIIGTGLDGGGMLIIEEAV